MEGGPQRLAVLLTLSLSAACSDYKLHQQSGERGAETAEPDTAAPDCADFAKPPAQDVEVDEDCLADIDKSGSFDPVIEWTSTASVSFANAPDATTPYTMPAVANIDDNNGDGRIDESDVPDIIYTAFDDWKSQRGHLRVISGDGAGEVWSVSDFTIDGQTYYPSCLGGVAAGDLDGDGTPEVVTITSGGDVVVFAHDGTPRWVTQGFSVSLYAQPALADLDGDGLAEVVVGNVLIENDGSLRALGSAGRGVPDAHAGDWGEISIPVDLDGDGQMEVVAGNTVYDDHGTTLASSGLGDGFTAVADIDVDGSPEIVTSLHATGEVYLWEADGTVNWHVTTGSGGGGPPTVADFDGDGVVEIGVAGKSAYVVLEADGSLLWSTAITDASSSATGSAVFDFDGNGAAEVVFADEIAFYVFDGATGAVLYQDIDHNHGTAWEYPVIADVDRDGNSEIVVGSAGTADSNWDGITVLGSATDSWAPSRPVWNQHAYHITNVTNDGAIPSSEEPNWETWNSFRAAGTEQGPLHWQPNIVPNAPEICSATCGNDEVTLYLSAGNGGLLATDLSLDASLQRDDGGEAWTGELPPLRSGEGTILGPVVMTREDWGTGELMFILDVPDQLEECNESDNTLSLGTWPCP